MAKEYGSKDKEYGNKDRGDYKSRDDKYDDMDDMGEEKRGRKYAGGGRRKPCRFTTGEEDAANLTYKNPRFLSVFMTEHGKMVPRRITGNCAPIQRKLATEIKRARHLALLGYTSIGPNSN